MPARKHSNILKPCLQCNQIIDRPFQKNSRFKISWQNYQKRIFCSVSCKGKYFKGILSHNFKGGNTKCFDCNKSLSARYSKKKRCWNCHIKFRKEHPESHPLWRGGTYCKDCKKRIYWGQKRCSSCYHKSHSGENSSSYKYTLTYKYLHSILKKKYGSPQKCDHCDIEGKKNGNKWSIHWANISGKYLRDRSDWLNLCARCHKNYDLNRIN